MVLPTHTTRPLRINETNNFDMTSVSEETFVADFAAGKYLEPDLDFALLHATGVYYGTPKSWLSRLATHDAVCAMPTSLTVARTIQAATSVLWVHLVCPPDVRRQRLVARGMSPGEVEARMSAGESVQIPHEANYLLDTSTMAVRGIYNYIQETAT